MVKRINTQMFPTSQSKYKALIIPIVIGIFFIFYFQNQVQKPYQLNLSTIFHKKLSMKPNNSKDVITIVSTGDVSLSGDINSESQIRNNFTWPFEKIQAVLKNTDISIINLESPLSPECETPEIEPYILCANDKFTSVFKGLGINVVNIANNHIVDNGVRNALYEVSILKKEGIIISGTDENNILTIKNKTIAFLGFNDIPFNNIKPAKEKGAQTVTAQANDIQNVITQIQAIKRRSDIVVVSFHWGAEYTDEVTKRQRYLAHKAIDSGADLIIGNHPHWIQPIEVYKNKLIVYSLGSLIFNQENFQLAGAESEQTKIGLIGKFYFKKNKIIDVEFTPIKIEVNNQPDIIKGKKAGDVLNSLKKISDRLIEQGM